MTIPLKLSRISRALQLSLLLVTLTLLTPSKASADGFRNPFHDAAAIGQGNAFAAQADNASAVFYNPAGMTQLSGVQLAGGAQFVSVNTRFASPTGASVRNEHPFPIGLPPPGQIFLTAKMKDLGVSALGDLSAGMGVQNLYGFASKFPVNGPFPSAVTFAQLPLLAIKPTLAYQLTESVSIGLGADILTFANFLGEGQAERQFQAAPGSGFPAGTGLELNGKGTTAGLNASVPLHSLAHGRRTASPRLRRHLAQPSGLAFEWGVSCQQHSGRQLLNSHSFARSMDRWRGLLANT